jgi:hypothetical protein
MKHTKRSMWKMRTSRGCINNYKEKRKTNVDYHLQDGLLYKMGKLCVPKEERVQLIREAHTSKVVGHFGVGRLWLTCRGMFIGPRCKKK